MHGSRVIKLFSWSTQLNTKLIMLINVRMPTVVGILTFISMITSESLQAMEILIYHHFYCNGWLKVLAQLN